MPFCSLTCQANRSLSDSSTICNHSLQQPLHRTVALKSRALTATGAKQHRQLRNFGRHLCLKTIAQWVEQHVVVPACHGLLLYHVHSERVGPLFANRRAVNPGQSLNIGVRFIYINSMTPLSPCLTASRMSSCKNVLSPPIRMLLRGTRCSSQPLRQA